MIIDDPNSIVRWWIEPATTGEIIWYATILLVALVGLFKDWWD
jgi:hypothetical protein